jgi:hypothetical protein
LIEQDVYTALSTDSTVTAIVASRIYPVALPKDPTLPAIDYRFVAGSNTPAFGTSGAQRYRIEVNCWGNTYADAVTLRNAVVKALSGYRSGNTSISYLMPQDFFESDLLQFRACAEFYVLANLT